MDKQSKLERLIKIADILDRAGQRDEASFIDDLIKDSVRAPDNVEIEIPEDEYELLNELYNSLGTSLK